MFEQNKKDIKSQWRVLNNVLGTSAQKKEIKSIQSFSNPQKQVVEPLEIANEFNSFFGTVIDNLKNSLDDVSGLQDAQYIQDFPRKYVSNSMYIFPTTVEEVMSTIKTLSSNKAPGIDGVGSFLLKELSDVISPILTFLINLSFKTGTFPEVLKTAVVIPLHKKGNSHDLNNYRPISLLSVFSKVIEKIMKSRLVSFFDRNNILCSNQFGFRAGKSTEDALLK